MWTLLFIAAVVLITFRMFAWRHADRGASVLIVAGLLVSSQLALGQFTQQRSKLVGTSAGGLASQDWYFAQSGDGNTATVGGYGDNSNAGGGWAFFQPMLSSWQATPAIQPAQTWMATPAVNLGALQVTPSNKFVASGPQGGPDHRRAEPVRRFVDVLGWEETNENEEGPTRTITVTSPEDGAQYVHQPINITAVASAKAASIVLYGDANELKTCIETTSCSTVWQSKRLPRGGHTAGATVTDIAGRQEHDAVTIDVTSWKREK
jgi:hypothetical protein